MKYFLYSILVGSMAWIIILGITATLHKEAIILNGSVLDTKRLSAGTPAPIEKSVEERTKEAEVRSLNIKGLYMTAGVASDGGRAATRLRENIISLAQTTEINGIVIDVKEVCGPEYNSDRLKALIDDLRKKISGQLRGS